MTHRGWDAIAKRLGVKTTRTARKLAETYSIPVLKFGSRVFLEEGIYMEWLRKVIEITEKKREGKKGK